ncbi:MULTISPECIES: sugar ABC transporter substrate-binding protein [Streptomyces]|uniref:Multiple sugar transport system substrate-binding protein n=1 Tax=Streptomyces nymphaeiformis TaxID=2663842 RepID=A0A7W7U523_9ACTN|nr:extracellular solute-binding protein [Streptomyces nymphaeiformis]MBB4985207.1 multiple sugar transport system substrate-binding protein [Streptomyces nymphaeiformis]
MRNPLAIVAAASLLGTVALTGCAKAKHDGTSSGGGPTQITMWTHSAGNPGELAVYKKIIGDFNASQKKYQVVQQNFPQGSYNDAITAAAAARNLPCLLDMDGPIMPNWAWAGYLRPLDLPTSLTDSLLPTAVGRYKGKVYSAGYWDAALSIFARKSVLDKAGIRIPTVDKPWTLDEFDAAVGKLKGSGYKTPLDLGAADKGEWWPYAYSPMLQSSGGDLIDRGAMKSADGALNGPDSVKFFSWFQKAFKNGWANSDGPIGNQRFIDDKVALSYTGVWNAKDALDKVGSDLLILPPVDFGKGPKIGGGSWQWGISSGCGDEQAEGARAYLKFSFQDKYLTAFADSQVVIPATDGAAAASKYFGANGSLRQFAVLSRKFALARPATPGYPLISTTFEKAAKDIMNGADVTSTLDTAVKAIDTDIKSNNGYGN